MTTYDDFTKVLSNYNFIGGAARGSVDNISTVSDDQFVHVNLTNGKYTFYYKMLSSVFAILLLKR